MTDRHVNEAALRSLAAGIRSLLEAKRMQRDARTAHERRLADHAYTIRLRQLQERQTQLEQLNAAAGEMEPVSEPVADNPPASDSEPDEETRSFLRTAHKWLQSFGYRTGLTVERNDKASP